MRSVFLRVPALLLTLLTAGPLAAQGVTTSLVVGTVAGPSGGVANARVTAVHQPSGTTYQAVSRADGRFTILGMRVGGPYTVSATALGFERASAAGLQLTLGVATDVSLVLQRAAVQLEAVMTIAETGAISSTRTGAATNVSRDALETLPTISRTIGDFTRLTPQASGSSFAGQDNRLNNITVDGSYFNNSFGLAGQPGGRTGVAPIPLDAIEQIQVNVAPFDVRQGNFVGAGVNAVTKSGTNNFSGSVYYLGRNENLVGTKAGPAAFNPGTFNFAQFGARLGGPIVRNKLFFFVNFEDDAQKEPGTNFLPNTGGQTVGGNTTRVLQSDVTTLSTFLRDKFQYETGPVNGYNNETPSRRLIAKMDFNANARNKLSLRYTQLDSKNDVLVSNSNSLGVNGNRRTNTNALSFQNSNYQVKENIRSLVGEVNSQIGSSMSNNFILGYTSNDESRDSRGQFFPLVDILKDNLTYLSFGFEPFTPNNELRYNSLQLQNNFSIFTTRHDLTFGVTAERYRSENVFFDGAQSVYTYNSLEDFYADANDLTANPNRTQSPVPLRRFQVRYSNIPGQKKPIQPLEVFYAGAYVQDEWRALSNLRLTFGVRIDVPKFKETGFVNAQANGLTFRDELGQAARYNTEKLPDANLLFSPRLGVNWDVRGDRSTQVRGGTGIFTGRPAYVWISNQIGNNGVLTGFEQIDNTRTRPFNPNPDRYKPATVTGAPAASYALALTEPKFKFPQIWRSNVAVDQRLPWGFVATGEFLYGKDVNGLYYINANLAAPTGTFSGVDKRPRYGAGSANRINPNITSAIVLKNQNIGTSWVAAASLERAFSGGFFAKAAYSYGESRNTVDPGSIALGSWTGNQHAGDPNNPGLGFSSNSAGHRLFTALSYKKSYLRFGATTLSLFAEGRTIGNTSYTFGNDVNADGGAGNDLLYVPRNASEMNFFTYTSGTGTAARTYTAAEQAAAWETYITQDKYLSSRRGQYTERGGLFLPMIWRADFSLAQDLIARVGGKPNTLQLRLDVLNVGNLLNKNWGVGQRLVTTSPLINGGADATGALRYNLRAINNQLVTKTYEQTVGIGDVYRMQLGLRYIFN